MFLLKICLLLFYIGNAQLQVYQTKCTNPIYCVGDFVKTVLLSHVFEHPKNFVDQKMLYDGRTILTNFEKLVAAKSGALSDNDVDGFVKRHFTTDTLDKCDLPDFTNNPPVLAHIKDPVYREFAKNVHNIWPQLSGQVSPAVKENPDFYSYIYIPHCFVKASVNFFVESYYWDSHWVGEGLIESGMLHTYKGMLMNMFEIVKRFGQMLNGNRLYYIGRSQPPFLTMMAKKYSDAANDQQFIQQYLPELTQEFEWWLEKRSVTFKYGNETVRMFRYYQDNQTPRPEGFNYDYRLANQDKVPLTEQQKKDLYVEIRSTAESGFDFGTRFMRKGKYVDTINRLNLDTTNMIPVDLNCLLEYTARQLGEWHALYGTQQNANKYRAISREMKMNIEKVLRHKKDNIWYDYNFKIQKPSRKYVSSNLTPLYTDSIIDGKDKKLLGDQAAKYLRSEGLLDPHGNPKYSCIPITLEYSLEQWDLPNCWAPAMSVIIEGLRNSGGRFAVQVADNLAKLWIKINYLGFEKNGKEALFEKYDAFEMGTVGSGGTYKPPIGFGWTNGFLLKLLHIYGEEAAHTDFAGFVPPPRPSDESMEALRKQRWDRREYLLRH